MNVGILLACIPFFFWAIGDFLIQKSTRTIGTIKTLFTIGLVSTPIFLPVIWQDFKNLSATEHITLFSMSALVLIYAITLFRAFKVGKLSVVESIVVLELPIAVGLAVGLLGERLNFVQIILFIIICGGVTLAAVKDVRHLHYHKHLVERGVWLAFAAAGLGACIDVYISHSSQTISPLMTLWYQHAVIALALGLYLFIKRKWGEFLLDIKTHPYLIFGQAIADNIAWLGFVFAVLYASTSLVISISEGYVVLAAILGHYFNKEKLKPHQILGASVAIPTMLLLAYISS